MKWQLPNGWKATTMCGCGGIGDDEGHFHEPSKTPETPPDQQPFASSMSGEAAIAMLADNAPTCPRWVW